MKKGIRHVLDHFRSVAREEARAIELLDLVCESIVGEFARRVRVERLAKSGGDTPSTPVRIALDIRKILSDVVEEHLGILRYAILGKLAGKQAEDAVKALRFVSKTPKGAAISAYLGGLDSHKKYVESVIGEAKDASKKTVSAALKALREKTGGFVDAALLDYKNKLLSAAEDIVSDHSSENDAVTRRIAAQTQSFLEGQVEGVRERQRIVNETVADAVENRVSVSKLRQALRDATGDYANDWDRVVRTELATARGLADMHAAKEIFKDDGDPVVVIADMRDDRVSKHCHEWSRNGDGTLKYYRASSLKPAGWNNGRKQKDWNNCYVPRHIQCRCHLVFVPSGFGVDVYGSLRKLNDGEKIKVENE